MKSSLIPAAASIGLICATLFIAPDAGAAGASLSPSGQWCKVSAADASQPDAARLLARASRQLAAQPHPLPRLHTEGTLPHQGIYDDSVAAARDFPLMREAALAWRLSGDTRYLVQVDGFLRAWLALYELSFNPIDETRFDAFIDAYALTRDALPAQTQAQMKHWLRALAEGYIGRSESRSDPGKRPDSLTWVNNWQSHRVKLMAMSATALEDRALVTKVRQLFLTQLANNVRRDGSVEDFEDRDALHYVVYDLEPLVMAALAVHPFEPDWLHQKAATGVDLAAAIDWLLPYARGERSHEEFVNSHVAFDRQRAAAGMAGYAGAWERRSARPLFWMASRLDQRYQPVAEALGPVAPEWLGLCRLK